MDLNSYDSVIVDLINSHFEQVKFLIKNNKNVLIEKRELYGIQYIRID